MNDTPSREPGSPRFLAKDDTPSSGEPTGYQGRFLNREPEKTPDIPAEAEVDPDFAGAETPLDPGFSFSEEPPKTDPLFEGAADGSPLFGSGMDGSPLSEAGTSDESLPREDDANAAPSPEGSANGEPPFEVPQPPLFSDEDLSFLEGLTPEEVLRREPAEPTEEDQDFQKLFQAAVPQPEGDEVPVRTHTAPKGRPKNKTGEGLWGIPNILVTVVWIAITVAIGVTIGRMLWVCAADVLAFGREDKPVTVTITTADDIDSIAGKLHNAGLIRYPGLFKLYASFAVDDGEIKPGIWELNSLYDYHALVNMMSPSSQRTVVTVMIPEGYSCRQVFELLQQKRVCTAEELGAYAANGELGDYWFLEGIARGDKYCLEGYLFPDTYEFYTNDKPANVFAKLLNNFDKRVDQSMQDQLASLNEHIGKLMKRDGHGADYIAEHQLSMSDVIIIASLIEKETASAQEGYTVASVIYNRLYNWHGNPPYLNIDAAMVYALDGKTDLTTADLQIESPYNTYLNTGLTPTPIANPGLNSIKAALNPQDTNYYYYVLDPETGVHHFSRTLQEHEAFRASIR